MKAKEVLKRYAAGERDFRGVNLRGQSFKGANLAGANFSGADIRSTNFTGANLRGANFTEAKCGLQNLWAILLTFISWFLAFLSGLFSIFISIIFAFIFDFQLGNQIGGLFSLIIIFLFLIATIRRGLIVGATVVAILSVLLLVIGIRAIFAAMVIVIVGMAAVALSGTVTLTLSIAFAVSGSISRLLAVIIATVVGITWAAMIAWSGSGSIFVEAITTRGEIVKTDILLSIVAILGAIVVVVALVILSLFISCRSLTGDIRDAWMRSFAIAVAAIGGTSFKDANLTEANFTSARLKSTDLRKATLTGVRWYGAKMLDRVRPGDSYLKNPQVRQWLIGEGKDKNFDGQKLQGINLQDADLTDASFIDANLSEANLQDADLSRAKLVQTQLDGTDFKRATLTGAFIEDWGITSSTVLTKVKCEYVFMRLPPEKRPKWLPLPVEESLDPNPRRKPDNWDENFEGDDFADFIKPIFDTLDLYHNQGVDPRAIAISWKQLAENNPEANLRFAAMEVKGENNLLLRLKTEPNADLSRLNAEYFELYNHFKSLAEAETQKLIAEKNHRIQALEIMVNTALKRPSFYAENYNHQGDNEMSSEKRDIKSENYYEQSGKLGIGSMSGGENKGNVKIAGEMNEAQKQNLADAAQEIQQLLEQLSENYPTNTSKEKMIVVGEVVDQIEQNPRLKTKVINALKAGGTEAFKEAVNHPLVNILLATIEGWQNGN